MTPKVKKWIIYGTLGAISVALLVGYLQYEKLMNYIIKFKGIKVKTLTAKVFNFDVFINFTNKSDIKFDIIEQDYKVYLNDKFVTKLANPGVTQILPNSTNVIGVNVNFNPSEVLSLLGKNVTSILLKPETINVKIDIKLKVSLYGIKVAIPYVYAATLKEMMAKPKDEEIK